MKGLKWVKFDKYHSYRDFSLILISLTIEQAQAKTEYIDIPGGDGQLDLTESFGDVKYSNRKLTAEFQTKLRHQAFYNKFEEIVNAINGRCIKVVLDEDENFYFEGRVSINEYKSNEKIGSIVIEVDCEPYKMENHETINSFVLTGEEKEVYLFNLRKRVSPSVVVSNVPAGQDIQVAFESYSFKVGNGTFEVPELELKEGQNCIKLTGIGNIQFKYRRGKL